jgi:hypothetical protein
LERNMTAIGRTLARWISMALLFAASVSAPDALAESARYRGLSDGVDILKLYRDATPQSRAAYDAMIKRLPPDVRAQVEKSDWTERASRMTPAQIDKAAENTNNLVIATPNGIATVDKAKMNRAVDALVQFVPEQPEFVSLLEKYRDSASDKFKPQIDQAIWVFGKPQTTGPKASLWEHIKNKFKDKSKTPVKAALRTFASTGLKKAINEHSDELRNRIYNKGIDKVIAEQKAKMAAALKAAEDNRAREAAEAKKKAEQAAREAADKAKTEAERKKAEEEAKRKAEAEAKRIAEEERKKAEAEEKRKKAEAERIAKEEKEKRDAEEKQRAACAEVDRILQSATPTFRAGQVSQYRGDLGKASKQLVTAGGADKCPDQSKRITKGQSNADILERVIAYTNQALVRCETAQLNELAAKLGKSKHPFVGQLRANVQKASAARAASAEALGALVSGQFDRAKALYEQVSSSLSAVPGACPSVLAATRAGLQEVTKATKPKPVVVTREEMEKTCLATLGSNATAVPDPSMITGYTCDCIQPYERKGIACVQGPNPEQKLANAHKTCKASFGNASYAKLTDEGETQCYCTSGYIWNKKRDQCVQQERRSTLATAHRACQRKLGTKRARATKYLGNGRWACRVRSARRTPHRRRVRSRRDTYDAAAAAAAAAVFIQGIGIMMNRNRGRAQQPHRHCHYRPGTRQLHCSSR